MKGQIGRIGGRKTVYWTDRERDQLKAAVSAFIMLHPHRTLYSVAAFVERWANEEDPSYTRQVDDDPQPAALCRRSGGCVCGGDTREVRAGCSWWVGE